jgi:DNA-binding CsgD family transcriptional regulator
MNAVSGVNPPAHRGVGPTEPADLVGRDVELERIRSFVRDAAENGAALLLSGDPGVGKTRVLNAAALWAEQVGGYTVVRADGVEFEAALRFSGLNQALLPFADEFGQLSTAFREALTVALGLGPGPSPGPLVVSNAALALLRLLSAERPVLLLIDDFQWMDRASASVFGFVARRLAGSRIGFLAAIRSGWGSPFDLGGLPEMTVGPLDDESSAALLDARFPSLPPAARGRLLDESQGNPLALIELPAALSEEQRAGRSALPRVLPLPERFQNVFVTRIVALPAATRRLLLGAVLNGTGDLRPLHGMVHAEDGLTGLEPAERARLIEVSDAEKRVIFRHPLIRSAIVASCTHEERRRAHAALAAALPHQSEQRAWHLAEAAFGPDDRVADQLEDAAHRILRRGNAVAAIATLTQAAELSPNASDRGKRRLAEAAYIGAEVSGQARDAEALLAAAREAAPDETSLPAVNAAVFLLLERGGDIPTAQRLLVGAIETGSHGYDSSDVALNEAMYALALLCWCGQRRESWESFYRVLSRMRPAPLRLLALLSRTLPDPVRNAAGAIDDVDSVYSTMPGERDPVVLQRLGTMSMYLDRWPELRQYSWRVVDLGRVSGSHRRHAAGLMHLCLGDFLTGRWEEGEDLAAEGLELCQQQNMLFFRWYFLFNKGLLAAAQGRFAEAKALADEMTGWATTRGVEIAGHLADHVRTLAALGLGDYEAAFVFASRISPPGMLAPYTPHCLWVMFDLVEAAMRTGRIQEARAHEQAVRAANVHSISPRLAFLQAGVTALVSDDDCRAELFERALDTRGSEAWQFETARIRLAYGEFLRRRRLTGLSRIQLAAAHAAFERLKAAPWATRAASELKASGQGVSRNSQLSGEALTAQEDEIAGLAASGLSNKQIAARLYLSPRTVGTHLYRIFPKLGITSRAALRDALARRSAAGSDT